MERIKERQTYIGESEIFIENMLLQSDIMEPCGGEITWDRDVVL